MITVQCAGCGTEVRRQPSVLARYKNSFCSQACKGAHHSAAMMREGSPRWRGGTVSKNTARQRVRRWFPIADQVCSRCNSPAVEWHHLDRNPKNNETHNLAALCKPCHINEHRADWARQLSARNKDRTPEQNCSAHKKAWATRRANVSGASRRDQTGSP